MDDYAYALGFPVTICPGRGAGGDACVTVDLTEEENAFDRCDREQDYETAWKFFEEKYGGLN